jgi:hypothetical protein
MGKEGGGGGAWLPSADEQPEKATAATIIKAGKNSNCLITLLNCLMMLNGLAKKMFI